MQNKRQTIIYLTGLVTVMALLAGCATWSSSKDERSDGRLLDDRNITAAVEKSLKAEPVYKFGNVEVNTFGGTVQLSGFVNTEDQMRRAEEITGRVDGVNRVVNGLTLKSTPLSPTGHTNASGENRIYSDPVRTRQ